MMLINKKIMINIFPKNYFILNDIKNLIWQKIDLSKWIIYHGAFLDFIVKPLLNKVQCKIQTLYAAIKYLCYSGDASFYKSSFHKNIVSQMFISQKVHFTKKL